MTFISIFWNAVQHRIRAFWRLLFQFAFYFLGSGILGLVLGLVVLGVAAATGALGGALADPESTSRVLNDLLVNSTWGRLASMALSALAAMLSIRLVGRLMDRRPMRDFGFRFSPGWWRDFGFGLALGILLMAFIFTVELAVGWISIDGFMLPAADTSFWAGIAQSAVLFLFVGIYEETMFRGYQLRNLAEGLNFKVIGPRAALWLAYMLSSLAFGLAHASNPNATFISTLNLVVMGLFLGMGFVMTGELAIPIGLHITWNFFQGNVFGFPVSGLDAGASFIGIQQRGPDVFTGGLFGPEAGLIGLAAAAIGAMLIYIWIKRSHGRVQMQEWLAAYPTSDAARINPAAVSSPNTDIGPNPYLTES